jgi:DNA-binding XRE family transcriptional regulator
MPHHSFNNLRNKMSAKQRAAADARTKELLAVMLLAEIRQTAGVTQEELARRLGIKQPTLSRLESQSDMQISTLERLVRALGGELEIVAHLPGGPVRICQFDGDA